MSNVAEVQKWLSDEYNIIAEDAAYIIRMVINGERAKLIETFISVDLENDPKEQLKVAKQVDGLLQAYKERFKSDRPRPKSKPIDFAEAEPSPQAKVPEDSGDEVEDEPTPTERVKMFENSREDDPHIKSKKALRESSPNKPKLKSNRRVPEVQVTDIKAPPKYPLSHGMGVVQINMLKHLIKSVKDNPFDMNDPDSGGIPLDDARPVFATLLMRGGVCEVVDALKVKKSGKKFWGKRVIPIMPMAQKVINDFKKRKPDKWKLIND